MGEILIWKRSKRSYRDHFRSALDNKKLGIDNGIPNGMVGISVRFGSKNNNKQFRQLYSMIINDHGGYKMTINDSNPKGPAIKRFAMTPLAVGVVAALNPGSAALAQDDDGYSGIEEIVVTATKRSMSIQDVAQST